MLNVLVANHNKTHSTATIKQLTDMLNVQVWNSKRLGWKHTEILVYTNFYYAPSHGQLRYLPINTDYVKGTKTGLMAKILPHLPDDETIWIHDLDAWQIVPFNDPVFADIGIVPYAPNNPHYNSGSVFYRSSASDIVNTIWDEIQNQNPDKCVREEFVINDVLFRTEYSERVTPLNFRYNLGTNQYGKRFAASKKPICVRHFHPEDENGFDTHTRDAEFPIELKNMLEAIR
jgi:hypothetical protein